VISSFEFQRGTLCLTKSPKWSIGNWTSGAATRSPSQGWTQLRSALRPPTRNGGKHRIHDYFSLRRRTAYLMNRAMPGFYANHAYIAIRRHRACQSVSGGHKVSCRASINIPSDLTHPPTRGCQSNSLPCRGTATAAISAAGVNALMRTPIKRRRLSRGARRMHSPAARRIAATSITGSGREMSRVTI